MSWLKIDDNFPEHERIIGLPGPAAKWLHVVALCHCAKQLTDGHIEPFRLKVICTVAEVPQANVQIKELVKAGLWLDNGDGSYEVRDFLDYNPSAAEVKDLRAARSEAGRLGGVRSGASRRNGSDEAERKQSLEALDEALASPRLAPLLEPQSQSPAQSLPLRPKSSGLLDNGRSEACQHLLGLIQGGDSGTPRVVERFCKQLPQDRIDRVASTLRLGVKPAIAVAALKREVKVYEAEVAAEGAA